MPNDKKTNTQPADGLIAQVKDKIDKANSILVALSNDPSVDEMAAAIGLTLFLDGIGKHATAIFSGQVPNALQFLNPEKTFETNTNSLQDFIIALNKEKADHLRYKIEGDYVKVYITPYRTTLSENDFEFSHGDYNVDLVISLDVSAGTELDGALAEYGRIMHDATSVNITTNVPGKFGELEWSDPGASSVSEMVTTLTNAFGNIDKNVATALLTGVVAATERFSNEKTTPSTMTVAARLMAAGADQQLISAHIAEELAVASGAPEATAAPDAEVDMNGTLQIEREEQSEKIADETVREETPEPVETVAEKLVSVKNDEASTEAELPVAPVVPPVMNTALDIDLPVMRSNGLSEDLVEELKNEIPKVPEEEALGGSKELELQPLGTSKEAEKDYAKMMAEALAEPLATNPAATMAPEAQISETEVAPVMDYAEPGATKAGFDVAPTMSPLPMPGVDLPPPPAPPIDFAAMSVPPVQPVMAQPVNPGPQISPVAPVAPAVPVAPDAEMNQGPVLPPVVTPITPATPPVEPAPQPLGPNPAMQDQVYPDPNAFKIPGM